MAPSSNKASASGSGANGVAGGIGIGLSSSSSGSGLPPAAGIPTSVYPTDTIKDVAESLGISNLKDSVAAALAADVEYRIRELVQDAAKYMRHAKRDQLRTSDIDSALRARNIEPLYGFMPSSAGKSNSASSRYTAGPNFRRVQTASGVPLHYVEDEEIDFDKILEAGPKIGVGRGVGWGAHWLAIEGVQPAVPQNPSPADLAESAAPVGFSGPASIQPAAAAPAAAKAVAGTGSDGQAVAKPLVKHILSRELQLYYERLVKAIVSPPPEADEDLEEEAGDKPKPPDADGDVSMDLTSTPGTPPYPGTEPPLPLKSFIKKGSGNHVRDAALASLRGDPGLHQLVPYLIQFVSSKVIEVLRGGEPTPGTEIDKHMLSVLLSTVHAMLTNPHIFVEPYLHQMMPSVLSILLTSSLTDEGVGTLQEQDEVDNPLITASNSSYTLRAYAAALLAHIADKHGRSYPTLKPRIVSTLLKALLARPDASAGTKLGAVMGLRRLGRASFKVLLTPGGECPLLQLGTWIATQPESDAQPIVREVTGALHSLLPPYIPPDAGADEEKLQKLQEVYGPFWLEQVVKKDSRARVALEIGAGLRSDSEQQATAPAAEAPPA